MLQLPPFAHHVFFWLNEPTNTAHRNQLIEGLRKLTAVSTIKSFHISLPAGTSREVIDTSYSVSWLVLFEDAAAQDSYQTDPIHLEFVKECSGLWEKVLVYDSESV